MDADRAIKDRREGEGTRWIEAEYGQLRQQERGEALEKLGREKWGWMQKRLKEQGMGKDGWWETTKYTFRPGQGAARRKETTRWAVDGEDNAVYEVMAPARWPWQIVYHVRIHGERGDGGEEAEAEKVEMEAEMRLTETREGGLAIKLKVGRFRGDGTMEREQREKETVVVEDDEAVREMFWAHGWDDGWKSERKEAIRGAVEAMEGGGEMDGDIRWGKVRRVLGGEIPKQNKRERAEEKERREIEKEEKRKEAEEERNRRKAGSEEEETEEEGEKEARETLEVGKEATQGQIRKAYRKKALAAHPMRGGSKEEQKKVKEAMDTMRIGYKGKRGRVAEGREKKRGEAEGKQGEAEKESWRKIAEALRGGSEAMYEAIEEYKKEVRRREDSREDAKGTTRKERWIARRVEKARERKIQREEAENTAKEARRAMEMKEWELRKERGEREEEEIRTLGVAAMEAAIRASPEEVKERYIVWLPDAMWGDEYEEWIGRTPFRIINIVKQHGGPRNTTMLTLKRAEEIEKEGEEWKGKHRTNVHAWTWQCAGGEAHGKHKVRARIDTGGKEREDMDVAEEEEEEGRRARARQMIDRTRAAKQAADEMRERRKDGEEDIGKQRTGRGRAWAERVEMGPVAKQRMQKALWNGRRRKGTGGEGRKSRHGQSEEEDTHGKRKRTGTRRGEQELPQRQQERRGGEERGRRARTRQRRERERRRRQQDGSREITKESRDGKTGWGKKRR